MVLVLFCGPAPCASTRSGVFSELLYSFEDNNFLYEQTVVPPDLRKFFIPISLAYENEHLRQPASLWNERVHTLLSSLLLSAPIHYVARWYAPAAYAKVASMCATMKMETALIFVAHRSNKYIRTVEALSLPGGFSALLFSYTFVAHSQEREICAVVARELTKVARRRSEKNNLARKIWWGLAGSIAAVGAIGCLQTAMKNGDWWQHAKELISYHSTSGLISLVGVTGCGLAAECIDRYRSRNHRKEANAAALKAFGGSAEEYLEALKSVEINEALKRQRIDHHYRDYYKYIEAKIAEVKNDGYQEAAAFLKNELYEYRKRQVEMPVLSTAPGIFSKRVSLNEQITQMHDQKSCVQNSLRRLKGHTLSEDDANG